MSLIASMGLNATGTSLRAVAASGSGKAGEYLADFLSGDVQGSISSANEIMHRIDEVKAGKIPHWERSGNAYKILINPDIVVLHFLYAGDDDDEELLSLDDFYAALQGWVEAIRRACAAE